MAEDNTEDPRITRNRQEMERLRQQSGIPTTTTATPAVTTSTTTAQPDPRVTQNQQEMEKIRQAGGIPPVVVTQPPPASAPKTFGGYVSSAGSGLVEGARENIDNLAMDLVSPVAKLIWGEPKGPAVPTETQQWREAHAGDPVAESFVPVGNFGMSLLEALALKRAVVNPLVTSAGPRMVPGPEIPTPANPITWASNALLQQPNLATVLSPGNPWVQAGIRAAGSAGTGAIMALGEGAGALGTALGSLGGMIGHGLGAGLKVIDPIAHFVHIPKLAVISKLGPVLPYAGGAGGGYLPQIIDDRTGGGEPPMAQ